MQIKQVVAGTAIAGLVLGAPSAAWAKGPSPAQQIKSLKAQVAKLKKELKADNAEIAQLKAKSTPPTTAKPATPQTIFQQSGSGTATTASFHTPDEWQLHWNYDCSSQLGGQGNFIVHIEQPPGKVGEGVTFNDQGVNQLGAGTSGVESYHYGGTMYLSINSECNWSVQVTG